MIILEGADGSGKTTLAHMIMAAFPQYRIIHSPGPLNQETIHERLFWNYQLCRLDNVIADRMTVFSEHVYGTVLRGESLVSQEHVNDFLSSLRDNKKNIVVFCDREFKAEHNYEPTLNLTFDEKVKLEHDVDQKSEQVRVGYRRMFMMLEGLIHHYIKIKKETDVVRLFKMIRSIG